MNLILICIPEGSSARVVPIQVKIPVQAEPSPSPLPRRPATHHAPLVSPGHKQRAYRSVLLRASLGSDAASKTDVKNRRRFSTREVFRTKANIYEIQRSKSNCKSYKAVFL